MLLYDDLAPVAIGQEMAEPFSLSKRISQLSKAGNMVKQLTQENGLPAIYMYLVWAYYSRAIQNLRDSIRGVNAFEARRPRTVGEAAFVRGFADEGKQ